jgi:CubicO group peptidase (beta-lactamase class C family)
MNHKLTLLKLIQIIVLTLTGTKLFGQDNNRLNGFAEFADSVRNEWHVPGLAVGIVKDGKVIFSQGFGLRDLGRELTVTTRTVFPIGSATKPFTAMAIAILVDDDKLSLDEPLHKLLPTFQLYDDYATFNITARDLLCHRSGMAGLYDLLWLTTNLNRERLFRRMRYFKPSTEFRDTFQYSNIGYTITGILVEQLGGMTWEEFLTERIFQPLGMKRTSFLAHESSSLTDQALAYRVVEDEVITIPFNGTLAFDNAKAIGPAGSIKSCLEDMTSWLLLQINKGMAGNKRIVSEEMLREMHNPQMVIRNPGYSMIMQSEIYGLGWFISDYRGYRVINHSGNIEGFSALISLMPEINAGIVVLTNSMNLMGYVLSRNVYDRLLGLDHIDWNTHFRMLYSQIERMYASTAIDRKADRTSITHPTPHMYVGKYTNPAFGQVEITNSEDKLLLQFESGIKAILHHIQNNRFKGNTNEFYLPVVELKFHPVNEGVVEGFSLLLQCGGGGVMFKRN